MRVGNEKSVQESAVQELQVLRRRSVDAMALPVAASRQPGNIQGIYLADGSASPDRKTLSHSGTPELLQLLTPGQALLEHDSTVS
jgi:hypothetical protein